MNPRSLRITAILLISLLIFLLQPPVGSRAHNTDVETADYLSAPEKDLIREINLLRANPQQYIAHLEQMKKYYKGKDYQPPGQSQRLTTDEGAGAVDEAIGFLRTAQPVAAFSLSKGLSLAAKDHVKDLGQTGNSGHKGTDGSSVESRVNRYGRFSNGIGENIVYQNNSAREIVLGWLVDDGVASRGHRRNLLSTNYQYIGVAIGELSTHGSMCVLTFAGAYTETPTAPDKNKPAARKF